MLHAAAAAASAVELVGGQCYCCACGTYATASADATTTRRPRQSTQQLAAVAGAKLRRRRRDGELLLLRRPRAARLLEKIGASLTEESAHFGFGLREKSFPCKNQSCRESRDKHNGPLGLLFGRREVGWTTVSRNSPFSLPYLCPSPHTACVPQRRGWGWLGGPGSRWVPHAGWGPHHTFFREGSGFGQPRSAASYKE